MSKPRRTLVTSIAYACSRLASGLLKVSLFLAVGILLAVASLTSEMTTVALSRVAETVFGRSAVLNLATERDVLRRQNDELETRSRQLRDRVDELELETKKLSDENVRFRRQLNEGKNVIDRRSRRIGNIVLRTATRSVASIPLESVPVVGAFTIVAITALEVNDACATMEEMQHLRKLAGLPLQDSLMQDICDLVPTLPTSARYKDARECREHRRVLSEQFGEANPEIPAVLDPICACLEDVAKPNKERCYPDEDSSVVLP